MVSGVDSGGGSGCGVCSGGGSGGIGVDIGVKFLYLE